MRYAIIRLAVALAMLAGPLAANLRAQDAAAGPQPLETVGSELTLEVFRRPILKHVPGC
jgi:hypothetical protein